MQKTSSHKWTHDTCQQGTVATDKDKSPLSRCRHQLKDPGRWRRAGPVSFSSLQPVREEPLQPEDGAVSAGQWRNSRRRRETRGIKPRRPPSAPTGSMPRDTCQPGASLSSSAASLTPAPAAVRQTSSRERHRGGHRRALSQSAISCAS